MSNPNDVLNLAEAIEFTGIDSENLKRLVRNNLVEVEPGSSESNPRFSRAKLAALNPTETNSVT